MPPAHSSVSDATPVPVPTTPTPGSDPVRSLLRAACRAVRHLEAGRACRVIVYVGDKRAIDIVIPESVADGEMRRPMLPATLPPPPPIPPPPIPPPGWSFSDRLASFDGRVVREVSASRVRLLKALAESRRPLTAKELTELVFDSETDVANVRYHVKELRRELKAAFADFEGELIVGEGEGYRLVLR